MIGLHVNTTAPVKGKGRGKGKGNVPKPKPKESNFQNPAQKPPVNRPRLPSIHTLVRDNPEVGAFFAYNAVTGELFDGLKRELRWMATGAWGNGGNLLYESGPSHRAISNHHQLQIDHSSVTKRWIKELIVLWTTQFPEIVNWEVPRCQVLVRWYHPGAGGKLGASMVAHRDRGAYGPIVIGLVVEAHESTLLCFTTTPSTTTTTLP